MASGLSCSGPWPAPSSFGPPPETGSRHSTATPSNRVDFPVPFSYQESHRRPKLQVEIPQRIQDERITRNLPDQLRLRPARVQSVHLKVTTCAVWEVALVP